MVKHLIGWYRRDRTTGIVTISTNCGLTGERRAGGGPLTAPDGKEFLVDPDSTTCAKCVGIPREMRSAA